MMATTTVTRSDEQIQRDILEELKWDARVPAAHLSRAHRAGIAAAASRTLEWDTLVPVDELEITVNKGWVTLKGEVEWQYQKVEAERAVRRLSGVRGVTNQILLRQRPRIQPSSDELKRGIEAERIAWPAPGVRSVNNRITITPTF